MAQSNRVTQRVSFNNDPKEGTIEQAASFDTDNDGLVWVGVSNNGDGFNCTVENFAKLVKLVNAVLPEKSKLKPEDLF